MLARYEKLDEYIEAINNGHEQNSKQPVYLSITRVADEENNLSFQIYIQVLSDKELALTFCYTDLPSIKIVNPVMFDSVFGTNETSMAAKKKYDADMLGTTNHVLEEKTKIINKLRELGFTKFINAILQ